MDTITNSTRLDTTQVNTTQSDTTQVETMQLDTTQVETMQSDTIIDIITDTMIIGESNGNEKQLINEIIKYLEAKDLRMPQGSPLWHEHKLKTIGGSEFGILTGSNTYKTIQQFIEGKLGLTKFVSVNRMQWGNLFEDVIQLYLEKYLGCIIFGNNAFLEGKINHQTYSPDGIGVVNSKKLSKLISVDTNKEFTKVLFEFKCLFSRIPVQSHPPDYYVEQVLLGLDTIDIVDVGILCEGVFRTCPFNTLGLNTEYNTCYETISTRKMKKMPIAYGVLGVYVNIPSYKKTDLSLGKQLANCNLNERQKIAVDKFISMDEIDIDFGTKNSDGVDLLLELVDARVFRVTISNIVCIDRETKLEMESANMDDELKKIRSGENYVGYVPWKLFNVIYHKIERIPNFALAYEEKIKDIFTFVNECNKYPMEERKNRFLHKYRDDSIEEELFE